MKRSFIKNSFNWLLLLLLFAGMQVRAQYLIKGNVTDATSLLSIPGVSIVLKGTTIGTVTDVNGKFQLEVPAKKSILVFSFMGYQTKETEILKSTTLNIALETSVSQLEELIVVGYNSEKKKDLTG